jgi:hypothetical protein
MMEGVVRTMMVMVTVVMVTVMVVSMEMGVVLEMVVKLEKVIEVLMETVTTAMKTVMMMMKTEKVSRRNSLTTSDPFVVVVLSLSFIASIFFLHIAAKLVRVFTK